MSFNIFFFYLQFLQIQNMYKDIKSCYVDTEFQWSNNTEGVAFVMLWITCQQARIWPEINFVNADKCLK